MADREFIGDKWFRYLKINSISFCIRLKKCDLIEDKNGKKIKLSEYCKNITAGNIVTIKTKIYRNIEINITILGLETDHLIVASNDLIDNEALIAYKQRWTIERTFKALKTAGFNIEDTHITDLAKLRKLFAVLAFAITLCVLGGELKNNIMPIKIKNHGHPAFSLFNYGWMWIKELLQSNQQQGLLDDLHNLLESLIYKASGVVKGESVG